MQQYGGGDEDETEQGGAMVVDREEEPNNEADEVNDMWINFPVTYSIPIIFMMQDHNTNIINL